LGLPIASGDARDVRLQKHVAPGLGEKSEDRRQRVQGSDEYNEQD
jgi:hypothetical protein